MPMLMIPSSCAHALVGQRPCLVQSSVRRGEFQRYFGFVVIRCYVHELIWHCGIVFLGDDSCALWRADLCVVHADGLFI